MPLKLLVDECILDKLLDARLRKAGHDIVTVVDCDLVGNPDHAVFEMAISLDRLVLTINCADFVELAVSAKSKGVSHPGILLVYKYNVPSKEMTYDDIVNAIANLESIGIDLKNSCHKLNDYKY